MRPIITIDGPAGAGKSTVAREIARRLGLLYLDTGAMYRAVTLKALRLGLTPQDEEKIAQMARETDISFGENGRRVFLDGEEVTEEIRTPQIDKVISDYVKIPSLRRVMVERQREIGRKGGVVAEGRDMGTVVFPEADLKIYLDASPSVRAERRWRELRERGIEADLEEIRQDMMERDFKDAARREGPLKPALDAVIIDTSDLTVEQVVQRILDLIKERIGEV